MVWAEKYGNKFLDFGTPLGNGFTLSSGENSIKSESTILGYSILHADSMDEVKDLLKGHPHLDWNAACEIEVLETIAAPGM